MRGKIYVNQPFLIRLRLSDDLSVASNIIIKYIDPDGVEGTFTTGITLEDDYTLVRVSSLSKEGMWTIWAFIEFPIPYDGVPSEPARLKIWKEGE